MIRLDLKLIYKSDFKSRNINIGGLLITEHSYKYEQGN